MVNLSEVAVFAARLPRLRAIVLHSLILEDNRAGERVTVDSRKKNPADFALWNEIAQSCAACKQSYISYWIHNGFVTIDSEQMFKSLWNFFTIRQVQVVTIFSSKLLGTIIRMVEYLALESNPCLI